MKTVRVSDMHPLKRVRVEEIVEDIPTTKTLEERYKLGKDTKTALLLALAKAIEPYADIECHTPTTGTFTARAEVIVIDRAAMKGEFE